MKVELQEVSKVYSDGKSQLTVLERVSFVFPDSGSVAIVGRSGVGKSTLLNLLGALDTPSSGAVLHDGENVARWSVSDQAAFRARSIGFILQSHALLPEFTAIENVAMPLLLSGCEEAKAYSAAKQQLEPLGLADRMTAFPKELSGGEQQRVAIARALVSGQRLVLADEPTGSLDVATAEVVQNALFKACRAAGALLVIVTHSRELAAACDQRFEMQRGGALVAC